MHFEEIEEIILRNITKNPFLNETPEMKASMQSLPTGNRKTRLEALLEESRGHMDHELYPKLEFKESESDSFVGSKQHDAALTKAHAMNLYSQAKVEDAVLVLLSYLETWLCDWEAYHALATFYIDLTMFKQAQWALEQVLLLRPQVKKVAD